MNKAQEAAQTVRDLETLTRGLMVELAKTRNMLDRMIAKHGHSAQGGHCKTSLQTDFVFGDVVADSIEICVYRDAIDFKRLVDQYDELMGGSCNE